MTTPTNDRYANGCEWCGTRIPAIKPKAAKDSYTRGLELAHIIARRYAPAHEWNTFILCPTCHKIFDEVIKPKIQTALETAVTGFANPPTNGVNEFISAQNYKQAVERLTKPTRSLAPPLAHPASGKTVWIARNPQLQNAGKSPQPILASVVSTAQLAA